MLPYFQLIFGFIIIIKGADFLVDGSSSLARRLKISDLAIGLTVVAFGTSTPELFVNVIASLKGNTDIAIANVLGSNIANILLILGVSSIIRPLSVTKGTVWKEIPFSLLAAIVLGLMANDRFIDKNGVSILTRIDGLVLMSFFVIFLYYSFSIAKEIDGMDNQIPSKEYGLMKSLLRVALGLAGLAFGAQWVVDGAIRLALKFGISQTLIGLTIVALGTSLPELATSTVAAYKGNADIAVGNVVGSNIFNIFFVLGVSGTINPIPFHGRNNIDIGMVIFASLLLFTFMFTGKKRSIDRWEGILSLVLYGVYLVFQITWR
jgi:cation:H+ antiporter